MTQTPSATQAASSRSRSRAPRSEKSTGPNPWQWTSTGSWPVALSSGSNKSETVGGAGVMAASFLRVSRVVTMGGSFVSGLGSAVIRGRAHRLPYAPRAHVGPGGVDVGGGVGAGGGEARGPPAGRDRPVGRPDRVLLLVVQ